MCREWLHTRAICCMHDFKDYIVIGRDEIGARWKEKRYNMAWRHDNKDTHTEIWARHAYA